MKSNYAFPRRSVGTSSGWSVRTSYGEGTFLSPQNKKGDWKVPSPVMVYWGLLLSLGAG